MPCGSSVVSRFYIGCDLCSNWFHGVCVGITEKEAKKLEDFVCPGCRRGQQRGAAPDTGSCPEVAGSGPEAGGGPVAGSGPETGSGQETGSAPEMVVVVEEVGGGQELYCICRTPYDETQ